MAGQIVTDLLIILSAGLAACLVCRRLHLPVLVGYLVAGLLVGKSGLGLIPETHNDIEHLAEAGVFLLLFTIGLEFSLDEFWRLRRHLLIGGSLQMLLVAIPAFLILRFTGASWQASAIVAVAVAFSSTILVFKSLAESGTSGSESGRRAVGILLFQDITLVPLLLLVPLLTGTGEAANAVEWLVLFVKSGVFILGVVFLRWLLPNHVLPTFANYRSLDLVVLLAVVCLTAVSWIAHTIGLPPAIGAFSAGLILSGNRWTRQIDALVLPFRETFSAFFFVSLGLLFDGTHFISSPLSMAALFVSLLLTKGIAAIVALRTTGLPWQSSFGLGIGLAHIGEFAFMLVLYANQSGVVSDTVYQQVVAIAILSLVATPILLRIGSRWIQADSLESDIGTNEHFDPSAAYALVIGAGPIGQRIASHLETLGKEVCVVDLSPVNLYEFSQNGFRTVAGDATDEGVLTSASADTAQMVVVSVPSDEAALRIVKLLRTRTAHSCQILVRCRYQANKTTLEKAGANDVISEETYAAQELLKRLAPK